MTMSDFPWGTACACWFLTLAFGIYLGMLLERHKENIVTLREKIRAWFDRWALVLYSIIAVLALGGVLLGGMASVQNGRDLVTNCQNANDSRAAARALWGYIIDLSAASHPHPGKRQTEVIAGFRDYVNAVYAPHDCSDLSKKYPLPKPPEVIAPKHRDR